MFISLWSKYNTNFRLCEGGELFDRIMDKGFFSEAEAHEIFIQIMQVLNLII